MAIRTLFQSSILGLLLLTHASFAAREVGVGDMAPPVVLEGMDTLNKTIAGPITNVEKQGQFYTVIQFFETENKESKQNLSPLFEMSMDAEKHVSIRMVATNPEVPDVKAFIKNNRADIRFPVHYDDNANAQRAYGVKGVPVVYILKQESEVIFKHVGLITPDVKKKMLVAVGYQ